MTSQWWSDDEQLLAALDDALRAADAVPRDFVAAGKASWAWHNIDAELAALTYDSARDAEPAVAQSRTEPASLRALTFACAGLELELAVTGDGLVGQLVPPQPGDVEVDVAGGGRTTVPVDEVGCFVIRPITSGSFRLLCRTVHGRRMLTSWITL